MRATLAVFLLLVLIGGCLSPPTPSTTTSSNVPPTSTPVHSGTTSTPSSMGVDAATVWTRVATQCGVDRSQPATSIQQVTAVDSESPLFPRRYRVWGIERAHRWSEVGGSGSHGSVSVSYTPDASPTAIERVLAHEYGHAIQPVDADERFAQNGLSDGTTDSSIVRDSIREGIAVYVADGYTTRYLDAPTQSDSYESRWAGWTPGTKLVWATYYFGGRYTHRTLDSCSDVEALYENPPTTSEQLLHPEKRTEPPVALEVTTTSSNWTFSRPDRMGELFLRIVLSDQLAEAQAADAAAGWGNDRFISVRTGDGRQAFLWAIRWDSATEASQFESAFRDYRETASREYTIDGVDERTVAVCAGNVTACRELTIGSNETTVTVST